MSERMKGGKLVEGMDVSTCGRTDGRTDKRAPSWG